MKCFECLVKSHIYSSLPDTLDPFQFAYRSNRSTDDAIAMAIHSALKHLEGRDTYVRLLFIDCSSGFNTIIPSKLVAKLMYLGLNSHLCNWILDFLTGRPQVVRIGRHISCDRSAKHGSNTVSKHADDTAVLGLFTKGDETSSRHEVSALSEWCPDNNLSLNVSKTSEMIVDYRKSQRGGHIHIYIK